MFRWRIDKWLLGYKLQTELDWYSKPTREECETLRDQLEEEFHRDNYELEQERKRRNAGDHHQVPPTDE